MQIRKTNAFIISIGNELLRGRIVDTNFAWISKKLYEMGIDVIGHSTIPDSEEWVIATLSGAVRRGSFVITIGGLGPTPDDSTRHGLSRFLNKELVLNHPAAQKLRDFFARRKIEMTDNNLIQAYFPEGAVPLENNVGTAPGILARHDDNMIFLLPGPPMEMKDVFRSVETILKQEFALDSRSFKVFRTISVPESILAVWLDGMKLSGEIIVSFYPSLRGVDICLTCENRDIFEKGAAKIEKRLMKYIFAFDESRRLEAVIGEILVAGGQTLAIAESCTGGMLSSWLVDIPGSSNYFPGGIVSYANEVKVEQLGVDENILTAHGAVSEQVAAQMSGRVREKFGATFGIGITGIAGPTGGTPQKPIGLVYISLATPDMVFTRRYNFIGGRYSIRERSSSAALNMLWSFLKFGDIDSYPFEDGGEFCSSE